MTNGNFEVVDDGTSKQLETNKVVITCLKEALASAKCPYSNCYDGIIKSLNDYPCDWCETRKVLLD